MNRITYKDLAADNFNADTFRAYMAWEYGQALEFGMSSAKFGRALRDAGHLAKRMGRPADEATMDEIFATAVADRQIIDLELAALIQRIEDLGYGIEVTAEAKDFLVEKGYDEKFGARPLKRAIQKYLEDPFAEEIINGKISEGDLLVAKHLEEQETLTIELVKEGFLKLPEGAEEALDVPENPQADMSAGEASEESATSADEE
mgnify:CR=1 FL=1